MKCALVSRKSSGTLTLCCCLLYACHPTLILEGEAVDAQAGRSDSFGHGKQSSMTGGAAGYATTAKPSNTDASGGVAGSLGTTTDPLHTAGFGGQNFGTALSNAGTAGTQASTLPSSNARHVILVIGDGMQLASEIATSRYLYGVDYGLSFHAFPEHSYQTTWDTDVYNGRAAAIGAPAYAPGAFDPTIGYNPSIGGEAPYPILDDTATRRAYFSFSDWLHPDSASTTTSMSTGVKAPTGVVAWDTLTARPLESSAERLRRIYGMSIGLATTISFSHARTAGFFAHNLSRDNTQAIAREILAATRPEVVIGGGWNTDYYDPVDLDRALASGDSVFTHLEAGVDSNVALRGATASASQTNRRLLALYGGGEANNFIAPKAASNASLAPQIDVSELDRPTLPNASLAALQLLARDPDGFFLVIEQGQIDWANNTYDFKKMIGCVWELDQAVRAVTDFVDRDGDNIDWSNTTVIVTAGHANGYLRFGKTMQKGELPLQVPIEASPLFSDYPNGEVTYNSAGADTSELVMVYAKGLAASKLRDYETPYPGLPITDNTSIFSLTLDAARR